MSATELLARLINELARQKVINLSELAKLIFTEEIFIYEPKGKIDYYELAELVKKGPVLLLCKRKRAAYAKKKVEDILGTKLEKKFVRYGNKRGYILSLPNY